MHMNMPHLTRDIYWDDAAAQPPYTVAAADYCIPSFLGSTTDMGYDPHPQHTTKQHKQPTTHTSSTTQHLNIQPHTCCMHPYKQTVVRSS